MVVVGEFNEAVKYFALGSVITERCTKLTTSGSVTILDICRIQNHTFFILTARRSINEYLTFYQLK